MQVPRAGRRSPSTWASARRSRSTPILEAAIEQLGDDRRPAPERAPGAQVDRHLQAPRGDAGRRRGDPAPRPHVGVPRPPDHDRDPAHPRLPRPQPALLRRPRQLLDRGPRAADLPRDRLRLDRRGPRPRRRDHDHGGRPTRRPSSCCSGSGCRSPQEGRPGAVDTAAEEEEERRKEEARLRAEAEQAALEQLKEENPEAYAKRERPEEGEEGEGEGGAERRARRTIQPTRDPRKRWLRRHRACASSAQAEVQDPRLQPLPPLRPLARLLPQVRPLPDLPARGRAQGLRPRHDQVELVTEDERTRCSPTRYPTT